MSASIEIVIGTYEEFLLGYKLEKKDKKNVLSQTFADKSHSGAIRCVAVQDFWIATGSADDRVFIYDMRSRKQSQIILSHDGTVNSLAFTPDGTHLLSVSDDGRMIATRLNTWFTEATWQKAHSGSAVTHVSCHPSGKLAISIGADLVLRTWNLVKGRVAYKTNLKSRNTLGSHPDCLCWSSDGDYFTLSGQRVVEIWSIKSADVVCSKTTASKPICIAWISNTICLVGQENGKILWIDVEDGTNKETTFDCHESRVKAIYFYKGSLVTASSAGEIKLWSIEESTKKLKEIAATNIGCRPTCITILDLEQFDADYSITKTINSDEKSEITIPKKLTPTLPERGIVTIEYEDEKKEEKVEKKKTNISNDKKADVSSDDDDDDADTPESESDDEPQIRLPKRYKREQKALQKKKLKTDADGVINKTKNKIKGKKLNKKQ